MRVDEAAAVWARKVFAAVDRRRVEEVVGFMATSVRFQAGAGVAVQGLPLVRAEFERTQNYFRSLSHDIQGIWHGTWSLGQVVSVEAMVSYELSSGVLVSLPCNSTLRRNSEGLIADYRIFMDPAPLVVGW